MNASACPAASAAVAAASTVSHACVPASRRPAATAGLGEDTRPRRVTGRPAQVQAAYARRATGQDQRPDHADRLFRVHRKVRHPVADESGEQYLVWPAGEHRQVRQPPCVVGRAHLGRHPVHRAGDRGGPARAHVRGADAHGRGVRRLGQALRQGNSPRRRRTRRGNVATQAPTRPAPYTRANVARRRASTAAPPSPGPEGSAGHARSGPIRALR